MQKSFLHQNEYRIYNVNHDDNGAYIELLFSSSADGPFSVRDRVISFDLDDIRVITTAILVEESSQNHFLIYTKGTEGLYILPINPRNGLSLIESAETLIAKRPNWNHYGMHAPHIIYNRNSDYYYLFVSYGQSGIDGNIRVGRSRQVKGPYLDVNENDLTDCHDFDSQIGYLLLAPYSIGPSEHMTSIECVNITEEDNIWNMECKIFSNYHSDEHFVQYRMIWSDDDWPLIVPLSDIQTISRNTFSAADIAGKYDFVSFTPTTPQRRLIGVTLNILSPEDEGISCMRDSWAYPTKSYSMGRVELGGTIRGFWKMTNTDTLIISYCNYTETYKITYSNDKIVLTGKNNKGIACFAVKYNQTKS